MIFEIVQSCDAQGPKRLQRVTQTFKLPEKGLESLLVETAADGESTVLSEGVFGEELLYLDRQVPTTYKKRADIQALDKDGNLVVVELKRDGGRVGVEMQALQ